MTKFFLKLAMLVSFLGLISAQAAEEGHDHAAGEANVPAGEKKGSHEKAKDTKGNAKDNHSDEKSGEHGHGDEHGEGGEKNPQVGADKGILAASEEEGIKLSPEAEKNFEIQKVKVPNSTPFEISKKSIVTAGVEVNLYRYRAGFYKRIDFEILSRSGDQISIRSDDLKIGDEIAITGLGFLRIAELAAFGGAPEGHSH